MNRKDSHELIIETNCAACGMPVMVDQWKQGICQNCGWAQASYDYSHPDRIIDPNMVSLNKARELIMQGKPLEPNYDEFIEAYENYGEMEFSYQSRNFGMLMSMDGTPEEFYFYEKNIKGSSQVYKTVNDLKDNAYIGEVLLKDIWHEVKNAGYMST